MALSVKILEKGAGTKSRTATASLGGLITSASTGYTGANCTVTFYDTSTPQWYCVGTAGTAMALDYDTSISCAVGKKIYIRAMLRTSTTGVDSMGCYVAGTTGGSTAPMLASNPTKDQYYTVSGIVTMDAGYTGNVRLRWRLADSSGATGTVLWVYEWQAIDLTGQFGAGSEPSAADLDAFYEWRTVGINGNNGMYNSYGDYYYYASKIASHGLEYNDVVYGANGFLYYSNVYPLNSDWIITSIWKDESRGTAATTVEYWTKADYTSRLLAKSLSLNLRDDLDGSASVAFRADATWQPQLGMTAFIYNDAECLFCGHISQINTTELNTNNWQCACQVSSLMTTLQWTGCNLFNNQLVGITTRDAFDYLLFNTVDETYGGVVGCLWRGAVDRGITATVGINARFRSAYDVINDLSTSSGLICKITADRRIHFLSPDNTPDAAPREITDTVKPPIWALSYEQDISEMANKLTIIGGNDSLGDQVYAVAYSSSTPISPETYGGYLSKPMYFNDQNISVQTEADDLKTYYQNRYGKVVPGTLRFTTSDLDYRFGQKATVQLAALGISSSLTMHIDSVQIFDADGANLFANVTMSNRYSAAFTSVPNKGYNAYFSDLSKSVAVATTALTQQAGIFTPALKGSGTAGTWAWTNQTGWYVRIGNMCYVFMKLEPSSISGSPTGDLTLTGLPFTAATTSTGQVLEVLSSNLNWGTSMDRAQLLITSAATTGTFYGSGNNIAWATVPVANISASDVVKVQGWYQCV